MALVIAEELGVRCRITSLLSWKRPRDIVLPLFNLQPSIELLFTMKIHRSNRVADISIRPWRDYRLDLTLAAQHPPATPLVPVARFHPVEPPPGPAPLSSPLRVSLSLSYLGWSSMVSPISHLSICARPASNLELVLVEAAAEWPVSLSHLRYLSNRLLPPVRDVPACFFSI